jgi:hypothetical protein
MANQSNQNYDGTNIYPTITGYVRTSSGVGVPGVTITFSNGGGTVTTNSSGAYRIPVGCNWSGRATPSNSCYTFSPSYRDYTNVTTNQTNQNYVIVGIKLVYISGYVRDYYTNNGISGVTMTFSNGGGTATTNSSGYYYKYIPCDWSGTVTPSRTNYGFNPEFRSYKNVTSSQTGQNFTGWYIVQ